MNIKLLVIIALSGGVGAVARFVMATAVYDHLGRDFPYGTLAVNVLGSLLMGFLSYWLIERLALAPEWRAAILIGFLGSFTTFSTFSLESYYLLQDGAHLKALVNIFASVILCLAATGMGLLLARQI
jgi:fluoride exporter